MKHAPGHGNTSWQKKQWVTNSEVGVRLAYELCKCDGIKVYKQVNTYFI